jgi:predicted ArsR family transcriptional regulator
MTNTKAEILALLKRSGHTVSELAAELGLASITIRQHLTRLQRDALVVAEQRSGLSGRPHYVFRLTAKAHAAAFPGRSDRLVELLLREVGTLDSHQLDGLAPRQKTTMVVRRLAEHLADELTPLLQGWPLQERVSFVTEVMHADGGFAEWEETASGYEIRDFNCLFHRLLSGEGAGDVCEWHRSFLSRTLGADVRVVPCADAAPRCCRYLVEAAPVAVPRAMAAAR